LITSWTTDEESEFDSRQGQESFVFLTAFRPAQGPIPPPVRWVSGAFSPKVKGPKRDADRLHPSGAEVKKESEVLISPVIFLYRIVSSVFLFSYSFSFTLWAVKPLLCFSIRFMCDYVIIHLNLYQLNKVKKGKVILVTGRGGL
jgi:hypothetical protein